MWEPTPDRRPAAPAPLHPPNGPASPPPSATIRRRRTLTGCGR